MTNSQHPLRVTVVSPDVTLNRDIAWVLTAVGYSVQTSSDRENGALWRSFLEGDVILIDIRGVQDPQDALIACDPENSIYQIVLYDSNSPVDFSAYFSAGASDAVRLPLSRGELIARIRTAARWLEFERRLSRRSSNSLVPGLLSKKGFLRRLTGIAESYDPQSVQHTLVIHEIDWYEGIRRKAGNVISRRLVTSAARIVKRTAGEGGVTAYLGNGRFASLQLARTPDVCRQLAEQVADEFAKRESQRDTISQPTMTTAIVPWLADTSASRLLDTGFDVLNVARQSGGDCIVEQQDYADEQANWRHEMSDGNPFANVEAQDIMDPFPAVLLNDTQQSTLVEALRRSRVPVCPYVDDQGKLIAVAHPADALNGTAGNGAKDLSDLPMSQPETVAHDANFPDVYEAFSTRNCSTLVVVDDGRPMGYITCDGFLSLIEPVDSTTYAAPIADTENMRGLLVPSFPSDGNSAPPPVPQPSDTGIVEES